MVVEVRGFLSDEAGQTFVEWAVLTLIVLAFTVPTLILIGQELRRIFEGILSQLSAVK